jgi:hypothetical protein
VTVDWENVDGKLIEVKAPGQAVIVQRSCMKGFGLPSNIKSTNYMQFFDLLDIDT